MSGKINFGFNLFECAKRDLFEEAGLTAEDWKLKAIELVKTYDNGKLLFHHYIFFVQADRVSGQLKAQTHKAEHAWLTMQEYESKETFPRPGFREYIINEQARPSLIETERIMNEGKFVSAKNISVTPL